jgi:PEP-CTERM/exosortase A-associated glycosyltransferase
MSTGNSLGRILHVFDHSFPIGDGYAFRSGEIIRFQRRAGWDTLHVTSAKQGPTSAPEETVDGLEFHRTQPRSTRLLRVPPLNQWSVVLGLRERLAGLVRESGPDIIHVHSPCLNGLAALPVGRRFGVPVVYELRSLWEDAAVDTGICREGDLRYRVSRALETYVCRRAEHVVPICEGLRAEILARGVPESRVTVAPNSVDMSRFSGADRNRDEALAHRLELAKSKTLGFIGSFFPFEGLDILLRAVPRILTVQPEVRFVLVGDGPDLERIRLLAGELGIRESILLLGRVPHAQVQSYYDLIDILIYPRVSQRLTELVTPLKPLEAMATGKLVVAADVGGHREMIRPGHNGCLFAAGDPLSLADTCLDLLSHPQTWERLKQNAFDYVSRMRSWETNVGIYTRLYQTLLAGQPGTQRVHA